MKEREVEEVAAGDKVWTICIILLFLIIPTVGGDESYSGSSLNQGRIELPLSPGSSELPQAQGVRAVTLGSKFKEPFATPVVIDGDRQAEAQFSASSRPTNALLPSDGDAFTNSSKERRRSVSTIVRQVAFAQLDHGEPGGEPLPAVPTLTHFGMLGGGIFFWTVEGPAGARFRLDTSTDLKSWSRTEGMTTGDPSPPSGFVMVGEVGERFFVRVTSL